MACRFGNPRHSRLGSLRYFGCSFAALQKAWFMESLHFFFETHWDHEPGRVALVRAPRSVTAQYFDVPVYGLLVGKIGSG